MYLVYIGESGDTGASLNDPNQRHQVYSGLIVHENQYVAINGEFNALCRRHFGEPLGRGDTPRQIKPADVYQGQGFFRSWAPARRAELTQDCLNILIRREAPVIIAFADKVQLAQAREDGNEAVADWNAPSEAITSKFLFALNMYMDEAAIADVPLDHVMEATGPIKDYALVVANKNITGEVARDALDRLRVDGLGLDETDHRLLTNIIDKFSGGPVGLETLAASLSEDSDTVMDVWEPYLMQLGFLERTPRGRVTTRRAYEHLGRAAPGSQESSDQGKLKGF